MKHHELRSDIERTRAEMSGTINAIEERLSPAHLREQVMEQIEIAKGSLKEQVKEELVEAKEHVKAELLEAKDAVKAQVKEELREVKEGVKQEIREVKDGILHEYEDAKMAVRAATIGKVETMVQSASNTMSEAKTTIVDTIRENPIPVALVGVGLVWMIMSSTSRRSRTMSANGTTDMGIGVIERGQQVVGRALHQVQDLTTDAAHKVRDASMAAGQTVGTLATDAKDTVTDLAHRVGDTVGTVANRVGDTVGTLATQTQQTARRVEQGFEHTLHDNPLAVGAAAFALGTAIGLAIPTTQREDALMGQMRDQLLEKAEHVAHDAVATAQEKVSQVIGVVQDGAGNKTKALSERHT